MSLGCFYHYVQLPVDVFAPLPTLESVYCFLRFIHSSFDHSFEPDLLLFPSRCGQPIPLVACIYAVRALAD